LAETEQEETAFCRDKGAEKWASVQATQERHRARCHSLARHQLLHSAIPHLGTHLTGTIKAELKHMSPGAVLTLGRTCCPFIHKWNTLLIPCNSIVCWLTDWLAVVVGIVLRALFLLGKCSTTWATPPVLQWNSFRIKVKNIIHEHKKAFMIHCWKQKPFKGSLYSRSVLFTS
jgi:hypothetical protein